MDEQVIDQAPQEQSIEDRIYAKFENPANPDTPPPDQAPKEEEQSAEDAVAEIEFEGARYQVPKELEKGFLQNRDYTQKTQEVAEQRRMLEQAQSNVSLQNMEREFQSAVQEDLHNIKVLDDYITSLKRQNFNDMTADDGFRQWMLINQANDQRETLTKAVDGKREEFQSKFKEGIEGARAKTHDILAKSINGYTPESFKAVREYGKKQGFPDAVLDAIETDPRAASWGYKAMKYDELMANKVASVKKLDAPVIKPGSSRPMPADVKSKLNYKNSLRSAKTERERQEIITRHIESKF